MAEVQLALSGFIGEVRVSQYGEVGPGITPPSRNDTPITTSTPENRFSFDVNGKTVGAGAISITMPQNGDHQRLGEFSKDRILTPAIIGDGTAVGDFVLVSRVRLLGRDFTNEDDRPGFQSAFSEATDWEPGALQFSSVGTVGITGAEDGPGIQFVGGVAAGERLVSVLTPYNRTGATPASITIIHESASDAGFTTDQITHKTYIFTDTGGGGALRGPADFVELKGDDLVITNEHHRFSITAVTDGTWFLAGAMAKWTD